MFYLFANVDYSKHWSKEMFLASFPTLPEALAALTICVDDGENDLSFKAHYQADGRYFKMAQIMSDETGVYALVRRWDYRSSDWAVVHA